MKTTTIQKASQKEFDSCLSSMEIFSPLLN